MKNKSKHENKHPFHLVDPSPWPLIAAVSTLILAIGTVLFMHHLDKIVFFIGLGLLVFTFFGWWRDVIREGNTKGIHTNAVQSGLKIGMGLFIASEVMFFAAFFWPPVIGFVLSTIIGLPHWQSVAPFDWVYLMAYAAVCVISNWLLQKTYEVAEASVVQPFAYFQIVFVTVIGIVIYGEVLRPEVAIGAAIVVLAGLYALTQARKGNAT